MTNVIGTGEIAQRNRQAQAWKFGVMAAKAWEGGKGETQGVTLFWRMMATMDQASTVGERTAIAEAWADGEAGRDFGGVQA